MWVMQLSIKTRVRATSPTLMCDAEVQHLDVKGTGPAVGAGPGSPSPTLPFTRSVGSSNLILSTLNY
jgi:hypothetical protein